LSAEAKLLVCPLPELRLGGLSYLNAVPLQWGLQPAPRLFTPAGAVRAFLDEELDGALLPLAAGPELQARFGSDVVSVRGVGIAARQEAFSVFVAHRRRPLGGEPTCFVDGSSRTSRALLEMVGGDLVQPFQGEQVDSIEEADHVFLIGDAAIEFRREQAVVDWFYEDLGELWRKKTGRPMVFAIWMLRRGRWGQRVWEVAEWLREVARANAALPPKLLGQMRPGETEEFLSWYWRRVLTYELGAEEEAGADLFLQHLPGDFAAKWI
jgi:chorismate dehydratase